MLAVMARVPFKICVTRFVGTFIFRTSSAALIPNSHREFLSKCKPSFETDEFVASRAGINPDRPKSVTSGKSYLAAIRRFSEKTFGSANLL